MPGLYSLPWLGHPCSIREPIIVKNMVRYILPPASFTGPLTFSYQVIGGYNTYDDSGGGRAAATGRADLAPSSSV